MKNLIKVERARHNMSQQDLADRLGITRQSVHAIETGKFVPSTVLALKMARLFDLTVEDIFTLEESDINTNSKTN
ncbi:MAG: helix-turn-helix transcriptional regulator [Prevotellaceae bacterium]|jgi:putative transcriptional regulator|nr:helix-turn-helix transcriptional regulator [Prevotellaceae bacterium]